MLAGGYSWRLFFYVEFAFSVTLLILAFFVVEETTYHRNSPPSTPRTPEEPEKVGAAHFEEVAIGNDSPAALIPPRKTFLQTLKLWGKVDREADFFMMMARSFTYFFVPPVLWVITSFGIYIGLGALAFNYTFPVKITAPPYNWSEVRPKP